MSEPINFFPPAEPALASQKNAQEFAKVQAQTGPSDAELSGMTRELSDSDLADMKPEAAPAAAATPPGDNDLANLKRVYTHDDVTKTPVMDLVNDKEFDPKAFAIQNPDAATDPKVLGQLREVYRQHKIAGVTMADVGAGVKGIPGAIGDLAKGAWNRVKNLHAIYLGTAGDAGPPDQASLDAQKKALGENAAATESAAVGFGHFLKGAGQKFMHGNPVSRVLGTDDSPARAALWENLPPGEVDKHFLSEVEDAKQSQAVASGEGEKLKGTGYSASELASQGITLDPANIESLTLTDPLTLAAFEGGFKIVNGATGKVLGTAVSSASAQKAIQAISSTAGKVAGQVVGQPVKLAGAAVKGLGTLAEKTGHAGVTGAAMGLATGHLGLAQAAGIVAADLGAPLVKKAGEAIKGIGKQITGEAPMTTGTRRIVDLGKAGGVFLKDIGAGAAVGAGTALATSESPEDTQSLVSFGGAFGAAHAPKEAAGKLVEGEFIQPKAMANTRSSAYGENPALDKATTQSVAAMPPEAQNTVNFTRELARKLGARVYVLPDDATAAQVIQSAYPSISPEQAGQIAGNDGFAATLDGPDGKPQQVVFLNSGKAAGHEMGHILEKLMPDDLNKKLDAATQSSFSPEEWEQKGNEYTSDLLKKDVTDWRTELKPQADANGMSVDQYLAREGRAENFDSLLKNRGADIGTPDDLYRRLVGFAGRTAESLGTPLVSAKSEHLGHPISLDVMAKSDLALRAKLGDEKANADIKARDIELRKAAKGPAPATPAPELPKSREEWTQNSLKSQKLDEAEQWAKEHGDEKAQGLVHTIVENQRANPEEPNPLRVTRQSVTEADPEQDRSGRRAERQKAYDNMDDATRQRVQDVVSLIKLDRIKKDNGMHLVGVDMNHVVDNAQRLAEQISILPDNARKVISPYATDLKTKSFTPAAWDELLNDYYDYTVNQRRGFKGGGSEAMQLPPDAQKMRVSIPPESPAGPSAQLSRDKELFLNILNGPAATIPKTARESRTGGTPGNLVAQDIAAANGGDIVQPKHPIKGSPEFKSFPGREIMETNPLRATMIKAGIGAHELRDVEARFNLKDVEHVLPLSTVRFQARNTDTVRGGFLPAPFEGRPVAETAREIETMSDEDWKANVSTYKGKLGGGITGFAWDLGASAKTQADVNALRATVEKVSEAIKVAKETSDDMDKRYAMAARGQVAREAYEAATGRSLDGSSQGSAVPAIQKYFDKSYVPPVPAEAVKGQARPAMRNTDEELLKIGQTYAKSRGAAFNNDSANHEVNTPLMHEVADWYQSAKDEPAKPEVAKAYNAFKQETLAQYHALTEAGYSIEPWKQEGQPYANSTEAIADLRDNKHLFYFPSEGGFGHDATGADKPAHPLMEDSGVKIDGESVPFNDLFRAVHDVFGHGLNGNSFGPRGEFNAWKDHAWLYSDEARPAMSAETLGQNSWVNFGSHLRDESGNVPAKGEEGFTPLAQRPFAEQKATVLPANLLTRAGSQIGGQFVPKSVFNEGKTTDEHAADFIRAKGQAAPKGQALPSVHDEPDAIKRPAVRAETGKVYPANTAHYEGMKNLYDAGENTKKVIFGFETNAGEFLDRKQAWKRAIKMGQMDGTEWSPRPGELESTTFDAIKRGWPKSQEDMTWREREGQYAPKKKAKDEFKLLPGGPGGFSKAWILPNGKVEQLGGMYHHHWLAEHADGIAAAKKYGITVPPFEGQDMDGPREDALRKGFVRVNYNSTNGLLQIEARAKDWAKQKGQVQQIAESNIEGIDKMKVSLLDDKGTTLEDSKIASLFEYDDKDKLEHLPFISEGEPEARTGPVRSVVVPITADRSEAVFGGYGGAPKFSVHDKAGAHIADYSKYMDASDHAEQIGGSIKMTKSFAGAALPKKDKGYEAGEYWLGKGKLHPAPDGHEQWVIDKFGGEHSGGEEDTFGQRYENYDRAGDAGYLRTVIQSDQIDVGDSRKYPTWADVPRSYKQALEDAAFRKGVSVTFFGKTVIEKPNIPEGQALPGYLGYVNEDGNAVGKRTSDLSKTSHEDEFGFGPDTAPSWRYNPEKKTVYWWNKSDRTPEELTAAEEFLTKHGQEVKAHKTLDIDSMSARNWDNAHGQALPKKTTLAEDQGLPGFDVGRSYNRRAIGEMTKDELKGHFPEAIVPHSADEKISSNVVGSPLAKQAGGREAAVKAFSDKLVDFAKGNEHLDEFKSGAKWYSEFTPMLKKEFGADAPLFAELLAATSPQTDPHQNFNYAFDAYSKFKRGDYKAKLDKFEEGFSRLDDGRLETAYKRDVPAADRPQNISPATLVRWWMDKHDLVLRSSGDKKIGLHSDAVLQVLARRWMTESTGLKTHNFVQNLIGTGDGATIDLWADRTMRRLGYEGAKDRWRILPENATGVTDEDFKFSQEAFAHAAERLKMKPSALQGALWFAEKKLWADAGWSRLNLGDYRTEMDSLPLRRKGWAQREQIQGKPEPLSIRKKGAKQVEFSME